MTLPSWHDTPIKQAILEFLTSANDKNSPDYKLLPERVAAFYNDGTLWVEQPAPTRQAAPGQLY